MRILFIFFTCLVGYFIYGCDSTTSPKVPLSDSPAITFLNISPNTVLFTADTDGFRDTTLTVNIQAEAQFVNEETVISYVAAEINSDETLSEGNLNSSGSEPFIYSASFDFETTTTSFQEILITVYASDGNGEFNFATTFLKVRGFSNNPPVILETSSPDTIYRPSSGSTPAVFTATVTDEDGDDTIERVFLRIIDQETGEVTGSPFDMADDGMSLGDVTANDHTYTLSIDVPANPESGRIERDYDIEFFAVDQGGIYSDTLRTTFHIKGN